MYPLRLLRVVFPLLVAACARGPASSRTSVLRDDLLVPAAQSGPHQVLLNGVRHHYRVAGPSTGSAPPVVFLHGGPGQGSVHFDALVGPLMERQLRMVYFDQRGSGLSERPASGDYALATLVEDVEALRRTLATEKIALIGHSFGGLLALEYSAKYSERVSHVVVVAGLWDAPLLCRLRAQRFAELRPEAYGRVRADTLNRDGSRRSDCELEARGLQGADRDRYNTELMFPEPRSEQQMDSVNLAHGVRNTGEMSRSLFSAGLLRHRFSAFHRLTMPVLVIAGSKDGAAQPAGLRELATRLPRARYLEFERSGHFVYLDEPERFAREVASFILAR